MTGEQLYNAWVGYHELACITSIRMRGWAALTDPERSAWDSIAAEIAVAA